MTIIFRNSQWTVEKSGMTGDGYYFIERRRLTEMRGCDLYCWPLHVCAKTWVDFSMFKEAFTTALEHLAPDHDRNRLAATYLEAETKIRQDEEYDEEARRLYPEKFESDLQVWRISEMMAVRDSIRNKTNDNQAGQQPTAA